METHKTTIIKSLFELKTYFNMTNCNDTEKLKNTIENTIDYINKNTIDNVNQTIIENVNVFLNNDNLKDNKIKTTNIDNININYAQLSKLTMS